MYWFKRSHETWLLKGDNNTDFFHECANGRKKRKNATISLDKDGVIIEGNEDILKHATEFYSDLFVKEYEHNIKLEADVWRECEMVSDSNNLFLCRPFTEEETKNALFQMETNKALGPDKISIEFYQGCWDIIKADVMNLFRDFLITRLILAR